jgi:hypothetical protein
MRAVGRSSRRRARIAGCVARAWPQERIPEPRTEPDARGASGARRAEEAQWFYVPDAVRQSSIHAPRRRSGQRSDATQIARQATGGVPGSVLGRAAVALLVFGCGDGLARPDAAIASLSIESTDDGDHRHRLAIPCADLAADLGRAYETDGETHHHTVWVGAADLARIAAGESVSLAFTDGHAHAFVLVASAGACPAR